MRSIGKVKIKKLKAMVHEEAASAKSPYGGIEWAIVDAKVKARVPEEWYDLWESAHDEINRIIMDEAMEIVHGGGAK